MNKRIHWNNYMLVGLMGFIFVAVAFLAPVQAGAPPATSGLLSMDLIIDDGWFKAVDDTVAADPDDVFLQTYGDGLYTQVVPPVDKIYLPKNLDVDLEQTQFYSDPYWASHELGGSRLFMNSSANAGVNSSSDITVTTELSFSATYGECKATAGTLSADANVYWTTELEEDRDGDGVTDETGDEEWLTGISGDEWFLVHLAMASDAASSSTDNWAELQLGFQTTAADYTYTIRMFEYAGDTDTTVGSISNGERAEFYSVGAAATFEHLIYFFNIGSVLADDSESPSIVGLDWIKHKINIDSDSDDKYITMRNYGVTVYREEIGITDNIDDNTNFDYDTSGIPSGGHDDADYPYSAITDNSGATDDTYDNLLPLEHAIKFWDTEDLIIKAPVRQIYFVSNANNEMELEPTVYWEKDIGGYNKEKKGYLVQSHAEYDWNWLDWGGSPTSYLSWTASSSKLLLEWELEYDQMCYYADEMDDTAECIYEDADGKNGYILQGTEQTAELVATFDGDNDDTAVTDALLSEPSQTLGGQATTVDLKLYMRQPSQAEPAPIVPGVAAPGIPDFGTIVLGIISWVTGFLSFRWVFKRK